MLNVYYINNYMSKFKVTMKERGVERLFNESGCICWKWETAGKRTDTLSHVTLLTYCYTYYALVLLLFLPISFVVLLLLYYFHLSSFK